MLSDGCLRRSSGGSSLRHRGNRHHRDRPCLTENDPGRSAADQPVLVGEDHDLHPVAQDELAQDRADVGLDGRLAGEDPARDLGVGQPPGDRGEDLALLVGQREVRRRRRRARRGTGRRAAATGRRARARRCRRARCGSRRAACAGVVSLSRNPLAPYRIAVAARSSRLKVVSTTTRTGCSRGGRPRSGEKICRVASTPSISGIRMSISTTSGASSSTSRTASRPSAADADHLHARPGRRRSPGRPRGTAPGRRPAAPGSRAGHRDLHRHPRGGGERRPPASVATAYVEPPADRLQPPPHAVEALPPVPGTGSPGRQRLGSSAGRPVSHPTLRTSIRSSPSQCRSTGDRLVAARRA